ncbi:MULTISPECIES: 50S ribosomal protein L9 [Cyanophyceae]|uniref:50S ribosomal protein L9 n=1 Tax=Cyanophyceae TaxID=3028117 RepID=UPI001685BA76|nr:MULTISPECIES: 50S ribosomal protein L9 [Cyanophyceae]MBD1916604.1 50S ribosomal protein L9 [Phormidium sp. FACHB-77]MBD2032171.1 50S ribosomal protein L9 [Phormidium sp. FACHB-322]MBD2053051.1 50S ribosomal protein L9 [Leptolyngbya sp. FACHB-60]
MAKRVQVVLTEDVRKLGYNGDLVDVAPGYARNYLIPNGKAVRTTPGVLKQVERRREAQKQRLLEIKQEAEAIKTALTTIGMFTIQKPVGENEAIFGTVTSGDVADVIKSLADKEVDRRDISVPDINKLGEYQAEVKLHPEVTAIVNLRVVAE